MTSPPESGRTHSGPGTAALVLALWLPAVASPPPRHLAPGQWGGEHVELRVEEDRTRFEFDCAHGQVEGPFLLSEDGSFDLAGTLTPEGGPTRQGEERELPARYKGSVTGDVVRLQVQLEGSHDVPAVLELRRDKPARLRKCG